MRDPSPRRWNRWRVALSMSAPLANRITGAGGADSVVGTVLEQPGLDGIRHGLVARVRAEIAAGVYDTEDKWLAAEEALLAHIETRM